MLFPKSQVRPLTLPLLYPQTQLRCTSKFSLFWFQTGIVTLLMMTTSLRPDCPLQPTAPQSWWQRTGRNLLIFPVCHLLPESSLGQPTLHALWAFTQHINSLMKAPVYLSALSVHHFSQPRPQINNQDKLLPDAALLEVKGGWRTVMERGCLSHSSCFTESLAVAICLPLGQQRHLQSPRPLTRLSPCPQEPPRGDCLRHPKG